MTKEFLKWIGQTSEYSVAACNVSHDINNSLAILMGYSENLEYMLETDNLNKNELNEICEKLFFVIDKLNAESRNIASARKKDVSEESTQDLSEYFHRWMKIQTPRFKSHGVIPSFSGQKEFLHSCNWAQVNWGFAEVFSCLFQNIQLDSPEKYEFYTDFNDSAFVIKFNATPDFGAIELPKVLGKEVHLNTENGFTELHFTCFCQEEIAKSAA
ncbi:MAG: hypothetical protein CL674_00305 [Bdellovibrionaceae bacterium]|nr:hypothetical protein [Pseudobdellovibrionaceae bacterium]|tara:strand:+ start:15911 stop:16552 length:642 start_codon:yes stop_codon:yes gene_type:complete